MNKEEVKPRKSGHNNQEKQKVSWVEANVADKGKRAFEDACVELEDSASDNIPIAKLMFRPK